MAIGASNMTSTGANISLPFISGNNVSIANSGIDNVTENSTTMFNYSTTDPLCLLNAHCVPMEDYIDSVYDSIYPTAGYWVLIAVYIITFLIGLVGNVLVCFAIWRNRNMRTVTNIYIVNLSVADLGVVLVCMPSLLLVDITLTWFFGTFMCKVILFLTVSTTRPHCFNI